MDQEVVYLNAFNKIEGIGAKKAAVLKDYFGSFQNAWSASSDDLEKSGLGEKLAQKFIRLKPEIDPQKEYEKLIEMGIKILYIENENYPQLLKQTDYAPAILYQRGDFDLNCSNMIAVVGSRKFSTYGLQAAEKLVEELVGSNFTIVSGLALGIDAISHQKTLDLESKTVAVLGSSIDNENIQPRNNFNLAQKIIRNGCLLSEYSIPTAPNKFTFPARNRIMAGLTLGTVVIEAEEKSGTLITAKFALEANREVFAVPGSILSPSSVGTHQLIKKGAKLITGVNDILEELQFSFEPKIKELGKIVPETEEEEIILEKIGFEPINIDRLAKLSKLKTEDLSSSLTMMELKGWIKNIGGQNYIRIR